MKMECVLGKIFSFADYDEDNVRLYGEQKLTAFDRLFFNEIRHLFDEKESLEITQEELFKFLFGEPDDYADVLMAKMRDSIERMATTEVVVDMTEAAHGLTYEKKPIGKLQMSTALLRSSSLEKNGEITFFIDKPELLRLTPRIMNRWSRFREE